MSELVEIPWPGVPIFYGRPGNPVVVVLHDMYGRLPGLDSFSTALAAHGFRVAVPDFYGGYCTTDSDTARQLMNDLDVRTALDLVGSAVDDARGDGRVGLVGFSLGGWLALLHAQDGDADAVVAYYASLGAQEHGVIPCPVLLHWAEQDEWRDGEDPQSFVDRLKEHGTPVTQHSYLATEHSFANASLKKVNPQAAALAFARTAVFLEKHLTD